MFMCLLNLLVLLGTSALWASEGQESLNIGQLVFVENPAVGKAAKKPVTPPVTPSSSNDNSPTHQQQAQTVQITTLLPDGVSDVQAPQNTKAAQLQTLTQSMTSYAGDPAQLQQLTQDMTRYMGSIVDQNGVVSHARNGSMVMPLVPVALQQASSSNGVQPQLSSNENGHAKLPNRSTRQFRSRSDVGASGDFVTHDHEAVQVTANLKALLQKQKIRAQAYQQQQLEQQPKQPIRILKPGDSPIYDARKPLQNLLALLQMTPFEQLDSYGRGDIADIRLQAAQIVALIDQNDRFPSVEQPNRFGHVPRNKTRPSLTVHRPRTDSNASNESKASSTTTNNSSNSSSTTSSPALTSALASRDRSPSDVSLSSNSSSRGFMAKVHSDGSLSPSNSDEPQMNSQSSQSSDDGSTSPEAVEVVMQPHQLQRQAASHSLLNDTNPDQPKRGKLGRNRSQSDATDGSVTARGHSVRSHLRAGLNKLQFAQQVAQQGTVASTHLSISPALALSSPLPEGKRRQGSLKRQSSVVIHQLASPRTGHTGSPTSAKSA